MKLSDWFDLLLPEQKEFLTEGRGVGISSLIDDQTLEFEYDLDDGFFVFCDGAFIINEQDADWKQYAAEQEENGVQRVVLLDGRGDVLYETEANAEWIDTPRDVKYHGLDILNVMLPYVVFLELEKRLSYELRNENESKEHAVLSLSASVLREGEYEIDPYIQELTDLMIWLCWKVKMMPQINEVRIAVWP